MINDCCVRMQWLNMSITFRFEILSNCRENCNKISGGGGLLFSACCTTGAHKSRDYDRCSLTSFVQTFNNTVNCEWVTKLQPAVWRLLPNKVSDKDALEVIRLAMSSMEAWQLQRKAERTMQQHCLICFSLHWWDRWLHVVQSLLMRAV